MENKIIVTSREELTEIIEAVITGIEKKKNEGNGEKCLYINHVAKALGLSHSTVKKLALNGLLRTTKNGMVPQSAVEEFLKSKT